MAVIIRRSQRVCYCAFWGRSETLKPPSSPPMSIERGKANPRGALQRRASSAPSVIISPRLWPLMRNKALNTPCAQGSPVCQADPHRHTCCL